jgi:hypothetical protein
MAGQLYPESLADALVTGGLSLYKLRRTTAYRQTHLAQE